LDVMLGCASMALLRLRMWSIFEDVTHYYEVYPWAQSSGTLSRTYYSGYTYYTTYSTITTHYLFRYVVLNYYVKLDACAHADTN